MDFLLLLYRSAQWKFFFFDALTEFSISLSRDIFASSQAARLKASFADMKNENDSISTLMLLLLDHNHPFAIPRSMMSGVRMKTSLYLY